MSADAQVRDNLAAQLRGMAQAEIGRLRLIAAGDDWPVLAQVELDLRQARARVQFIQGMTAAELAAVAQEISTWPVWLARCGSVWNRLDASAGLPRRAPRRRPSDRAATQKLWKRGVWLRQRKKHGFCVAPAGATPIKEEFPCQRANPKFSLEFTFNFPRSPFG